MGQWLTNGGCIGAQEKGSCALLQGVQLGEASWQTGAAASIGLLNTSITAICLKSADSALPHEQEDSDMAYFSLDVGPIQKRCEERGDIKHVRFPVRDFDPYDLRRKLPKAVARLAR